jgi:chromosome segregation ATPase
MPGTQRLNTINIRRGELETQRRELEERIRPLRLRLTELTEQEELVRNRVTEDRHRLRLARDAADDRGLTSTTNRNLRQSNLALALREEVYKIKQHYANNTTNSEACRRSEARVAKLHTRLDRRRSQAFNALTTQAERAENAFFASRDALALINRELLDLISTLRELETALIIVVAEEARLNLGRGKKRQRRATHKKGKNTIKRRL